MPASQNCNVILLGVSYSNGMASSTRVRNLLEPLLRNNLIVLSNLIFKSEGREVNEVNREPYSIKFEVIDFNTKNVFSLFQFWWRGIAFLRNNKVKGYSNIIYNYSYPDLKNIVFLIYAKLSGFKIVFDIVEDNKYERPVGWLNYLRIRSSWFLFDNSRFFANAYLAISDRLVDRVREVSGSNILVQLIPVTVNLKYFNNSEKSGLKDRIKVFYGGSFGEKDGLDFLMNAFEAVTRTERKVELILTGSGNKFDLEKVLHKVEHAPNRDQIKFLGYLDIADYYKILSECDIFCMTRINSRFANAGFPFKLGEYLASGGGIIATSVGDVPKYMVNDVNGFLVEPNSADEIACALKKYIENPEKITQHGSKARKTAETFFDSDLVSMKLMDIFRTV